jgi:hypothetical protein
MIKYNIKYILISSQNINLNNINIFIGSPVTLKQNMQDSESDKRENVQILWNMSLTYFFSRTLTLLKFSCEGGRKREAQRHNTWV